jgi:hypothetical protein
MCKARDKYKRGEHKSIKGIHRFIKSIARRRVKDQQGATGERPARGKMQAGKTAREREGLKKA